MKNKIISMLRLFLPGVLFVSIILGLTTSGVSAMEQPSGSKRQKEIYAKLQRLDNIVYTSSEQVLDTLEALGKESLTRKSAAYLNLLKTIARERCGKAGKGDSLVFLSEKWFRQTGDQKNLFRALTCKGVVKSSRLYTDSVSYMSFIEAENLLNRYKIEDKYCECVLYRNLGRINRHHANYKAAEYYLKKGLGIAESLTDFREIYKLRIELFRTHLVQKHYSEALESISGFADIDSLPPQTAYDLYNEMSFYHSSRGEYDLSISYLKNILAMKETINFEPNELSSVYYRIAAYHNKYKNTDSSLYYSQLAALNAKDTLDTRRHFYFKNLAEMYALKGDDSAALENYRIAYKSHINVNSEIMKNRVMEVEQRHTLEMKDIQLQKVRTQRMMFIISTVALLISVAYITLIIRKKMASSREERQMALEKLTTIESKIERDWVKNRIREASAELMPKIMADISRETARQRVANPSFSVELEDSLKEVRERIRNSVSEITTDKNFFEIYPYMKELTFLSGMEKVILVMLEKDHPAEEIAEFLCTSASSVRGAKGNIRKKIFSADNLSFDPASTFHSL